MRLINKLHTAACRIGDLLQLGCIKVFSCGIAVIGGELKIQLVISFLCHSRYQSSVLISSTPKVPMVNVTSQRSRNFWYIRKIVLKAMCPFTRCAHCTQKHTIAPIKIIFEPCYFLYLVILHFYRIEFRTAIKKKSFLHISNRNSMFATSRIIKMYSTAINLNTIYQSNFSQRIRIL